MSTTEQIYERMQSLPPSTQQALLQIVELLASQSVTVRNPTPKAGSAKGLIEIATDFDEPLADFKPYME